MILLTAVAGATMLWAATEAPTTRECVWEMPGKARVTITYYQNEERYLRFNDVRVEILDRNGLVGRAPESRHGRYWYIFARDSTGESVAEDDYAPPRPICRQNISAVRSRRGQIFRGSWQSVPCLRNVWIGTTRCCLVSNGKRTSAIAFVPPTDSGQRAMMPRRQL